MSTSISRVAALLGRVVSALLVVALVVAVLPTTARAHSTGVTITIGSTAPGGGALHADFDFASVIPVSFTTALGGTRVYTADTPTIGVRTADGAGVFALADGTEVHLELTEDDGGTTAVKIGNTVLDAVGETALLGVYDAGAGAFHVDPGWQLLLPAPVDTYGERVVGFRLTSPSVTYAGSVPYQLRLSNGHLPALALDTVAYDASALACRKVVAAATLTFTVAQHKALAKCLDKIGVADARRAAGLDDTKARAAAAGECDGDLLAKIASARAKAAAQIEKKCGPLAAAEIGPRAIAAHLDYVACEIDRLVGASYGGAAAVLESLTVGGASLASRFPCLASAPANTEVP